MVHNHFPFSFHYDRRVNSVKIITDLTVPVLQLHVSRIFDILRELIEAVDWNSAGKRPYSLDKLYSCVAKSAIVSQHKCVNRTRPITPAALHSDLCDPMIRHHQGARRKICEADAWVSYLGVSLGDLATMGRERSRDGCCKDEELHMINSEGFQLAEGKP